MKIDVAEVGPGVFSTDVLVAGGGPAGVVAAVQAARAGASVLLIEKCGQLGGTTTSGGVDFPGLFHAWGRQVIAGAGWEWVARAVREAGGAMPDFTQWRGVRHWRQQIRVNAPVYAAVADDLVKDSGARLLLHSMPAAVASDPDGGWRVALCCKEGLRVARARVLVDCTGDANLVRLAGLPTRRNERLQPGTLVMRASGYDFDKLTAQELARMEADFAAAVASGAMRRSDFQARERPVAGFLFGRGGNSMHVPGVDGSTSEGRTEAEVRARAAMLRIVRFFRGYPFMGDFRIEWCAPECGIRETVTIEGELEVAAADYVSGRRWPDAVCHSFYPIDVHSTDGKGGIDTRPLAEGIVPTMPLRALLPKGGRNLIVAGRCACGDQESSSAFRVQASAMAMGQVSGAVAALAALGRCELRDVPLETLKCTLREHGAIVP